MADPPPQSGGGDVQEAASGTQHQGGAEASGQPSTPPSITQAQNRVTDAPPPFWLRGSTRHARSASSVSYHSLTESRPPAISLEDHSEEDHDQAQSCWAQSVTVDDYYVVSGPSGVGAYVVWHCTVSTLKGGDLNIRKRYSEFDRLRADLIKAFPHAEAMLPQLPRKSFISRFRPKFLDQRQTGLAHFLNCVILNPEFASSPMLKDFIFA